MLRNIVFLALALALVSAVEDNAFGEALDMIKLMKSQGLGANECQALADSSLTAVSSTKDTNQKLLNSLSTGSECAQSEQTGVAAAKKSLNDATNAATEAKSALDNANAVVPAIEIPSMSALKGMGESCGFFYNSDAFKNGNAAVTTAHTRKTEADALVVSSKAALQAAKDAATKKAKECRCVAKTTLSREWAIASNPETAANQKSEWDKAQNILCALSAKSPCNAPAVPTVVKPTLSADTEAEDCYVAPSQTVYYKYLNFQGLAGNDIDCAKFSSQDDIQKACTADSACKSFQHAPTYGPAKATNGWYCRKTVSSKGIKNNGDALFVKAVTQTGAKCADGFTLATGEQQDIPDWGDVEYIGDGMKVASCGECQAACLANDKCRSTECSPNDLKCNLNEARNPTAGRSLNYDFCMRN